MAASSSDGSETVASIDVLNGSTVTVAQWIINRDSGQHLQRQSAETVASSSGDGAWTVVEPRSSITQPSATVRASIRTDLAPSIQQLFPSFDPTRDEAQVYQYTHIASYYGSPPAHSAVPWTADRFQTPGSSDHFRRVAYMLLHVKPAAVGTPGSVLHGVPQRDTVVFIHKGVRGELDHHYSSGLHGDSKYYFDAGENHPHIINFNWMGYSGPKRRVKFILLDPNTYIGLNPAMGYKPWFYAKRCTGSELSRTFWQQMASKPLLPAVLSHCWLDDMD